ncbi:MAG: hypothetical protein ACLRWQ_15015 [Flavonifractor plautii]
MSNMIQAAQEQVAALTQAAYEKAAAEGLLPAGAEVKATIEIPRTCTHGDYASSFAMAGAKALHKAPVPSLEAIVDHLELAGQLSSEGGDRRPRLSELHAWAPSGTAMFSPTCGAGGR